VALTANMTHAWGGMATATRAVGPKTLESFYPICI